MRLRLVAVGLIALSALVWACGSTPPPKPAMQADQPLPSEMEDPDAAAAWSHDDPDAGGEAGTMLTGAGGSLQGNEDGAKELLKQFTAPNADVAALTRSLKPTSADYGALFDAATAPKVESAQSKDWESGKAAIKPAAGQTDIKIVSATGADLAAGKGNANMFPKDYKKFAKHLIPTAIFFRFKFVKPGEESGTAYDGLAFVNGHWVIAPKPYAALNGKGGGLDEAGTDDSTAKTTPAKKPKAGGKKKKKP